MNILENASLAEKVRLTDLISTLGIPERMTINGVSVSRQDIAMQVIRAVEANFIQIGNDSPIENQQGENTESLLNLQGLMPPVASKPPVYETQDFRDFTSQFQISQKFLNEYPEFGDALVSVLSEMIRQLSQHEIDSLNLDAVECTQVTTSYELMRVFTRNEETKEAFRKEIEQSAESLWRTVIAAVPRAIKKLKSSGMKGSLKNMDLANGLPPQLASSLAGATLAIPEALREGLTSSDAGLGTALIPTILIPYFRNRISNKVHANVLTYGGSVALGAWTSAEAIQLANGESSKLIMALFVQLIYLAFWMHPALSDEAGEGVFLGSGEWPDSVNKLIAHLKGHQNGYGLRFGGLARELQEVVQEWAADDIFERLDGAFDKIEAVYQKGYSPVQYSRAYVDIVEFINQRRTGAPTKTDEGRQSKSLLPAKSGFRRIWRKRG